MLTGCNNIIQKFGGWTKIQINDIYDLALFARFYVWMGWNTRIYGNVTFLMCNDMQGAIVRTERQ